jgi:uncharacterized protein YndB with AHSA1/START domain
MVSPTQQPDRLTMRRVIPAARQRVFDAWTNPEALKQWSAPGDLTNPLVEVDLTVGGRYRITMLAPDGRQHQVTGVYRLVDPPRRLAYTWFWETNPSLGEMLVEVEFIERGAKTEVVLQQSLLPSPEAIANHERGWAGCLLKLESLFTGQAKKLVT